MTQQAAGTLTICMALALALAGPSARPLVQQAALALLAGALEPPSGASWALLAEAEAGPGLAALTSQCHPVASAAMQV
jgi:hypothetical protein